jgi:hypothetical protein
MAGNSPGFNHQFYHNGLAADGFKLWSYLAGTVTPEEVWMDSAGTVSHENPMILDEQGRPPGANLFLSDGVAYDFELLDPDDVSVEQWVDVLAVPAAATETFVPIAGDVTMTGLFELSGNATSNLNPVPLQQVNSLIAAAVAAAVASVTTNLAPVGFVGEWGTETPPTKWLVLNGAAVSRATYAELFTLWGVTYGDGDGTTTFNLQDRRGLFARGLDQGAGVDVGRVLGALQLEDVGPHTHSYVATSNGNPGGAEGGARDSAGHGISYTTGDSSGDETRPINATTLWIVKALP